MTFARRPGGTASRLRSWLNERASARPLRVLACEWVEDRRMLTIVSPFSELVVDTANTEVLPLAGTASPGGYTPAQIRQAYGFDDILFAGGTIVGDGTGQTIAIVNAYHTPNAAADLAAFSAYFGLPMPPSFVQVDQYGGTNYPGTSAAWAVETALDVQWAHALAPGANILLVEAASSTFSDLMVAVDYARSQVGVSVVSMSWGAGEWAGELAYDTHFVTPPNHGNVTFIAAAGNLGSPGVYPAYSPAVMAVGGTTLALDAANNILSETAWSGGGGGPSIYESQPSWQNGVVTQTTKRASPDVAFAADKLTGVAVYDTFTNAAATPWSKVGGTSFATPAWAALVAIADQGRNLVGLPTLDIPELMSQIYAMPAGNFYDITSGSSSGATPQAAGPGYDLVTGRGTPKAELVVQSLVGLSSVAGVVFDDANGNGVLDGEAGLAGWTVYADLNSNGTFDAPAASTSFSTNVPKSIFSNSTVTSSNVVSGLVGGILDVNVKLNINHTRVSDLVITLVAPDGTRVKLADHVGGSGDHFTNTIFDDSAPIAVSSGSAPFAASYHPAESLLGLFGKNPNGTWKLEVRDTVTGETGVLNSWSLVLSTGDPNAVTAADGTYHIDALPAGSYLIRQVLQSEYSPTAPSGGYFTISLPAAAHLAEQNLGNQSQSASGSTIAGRRLFYNNSYFDGNSTAIDASDDGAIAPDKSAYLPGDGLSVFANVSSYSRGINGIMIDISGAHGSISANDFSFKVGNNNTPASWAAAPQPTAVVVRPGAGVSGSDRVEITWADGAIVNAWLEVQVLAGANTGLTSADVFYWGSKVGDLGDPTATTFSTTATSDALAILAGGLGAATGITDVRDIDRSNVITAAGDRAVASANIGTIARIEIAAPGPLAPLAGATATGGSQGSSQNSSPSAPAPQVAAPSSPAPTPDTAPLVAQSDSGNNSSTLDDRARQLALSAAAWRFASADLQRAGHGWLDEDIVDLLAGAWRSRGGRR